MTTLEELREEWVNGDVRDRPQRIQTLRDDIRRHTGEPVPRRLSEIESWADRKAGVVTRKLNEALEEADEE